MHDKRNFKGSRLYKTRGEHPPFRPPCFFIVMFPSYTASAQPSRPVQWLPRAPSLLRIDCAPSGRGIRDARAARRCGSLPAACFRITAPMVRPRRSILEDVLRGRARWAERGKMQVSAHRAPWARSLRGI